MVYYTVDGVPLVVGMPIWIFPHCGDGIGENIVAEVPDPGYKVLYGNPDPEGYIGARINLVYSSRAAAEKAKLVGAL